MNRRISTVLALAVFISLATAVDADEIKVDRYEIKVQSVAQDSTIVFRDFSVENTDFGKQKKKTQQDAAQIMRTTAPLAFREAFVRHLNESGSFAGVEAATADTEIPQGALVVEGEFTALNPGSRAKRYWVGMGAGRSKICIAGRVINASGETIVSFDDCR